MVTHPKLGSWLLNFSDRTADGHTLSMRLLIFGRDAILPLNKLLQPQVGYLGNDENILLMQTLKNIYEVVAQNLKVACTKITDNIN